jgi:hypoxanthine phosphoribosyltransferase
MEKNILEEKDEIKKVFVSWKEVENLIDILYTSILQSGKKFEQIHGIPRGGLIPAVMLSHKLNLPFTPYPELFNSNKTLVIDDIADSGKTLQRYENYPTVVLHYKPHTSKHKPHYYASKFTSNDWIVYPWEAKDSNTIQDYKV